MNTPTYPANSLYVRLHGTAPARVNPIAIPRDIAAWAPESAIDERHDRRVQYGAAAIVLVVAIVAAALVLG